MNKRGRGRLGVCAALCVLPALFSLSCRKYAGEMPMKDGYYTAQAAEFDEHGWKEYVTIYVAGGRIHMVEYNAFNPSGFVKSWDMNYMRQMNRICGTYPNAYTRLYAAQLIRTQDSGQIDVLSGATTSWHSFKALTAAVMDNSRRGIIDASVTLNSEGQ